MNLIEVKKYKKDRALITTAWAFAARATCLRRQVGAVIALDDRIISTGYNGAPSGVEHCNEENCNQDKPCTRTIHAELNAILFAAKQGIPTKGTTMYCTTEPCLECSRAMVNAGIKKVVYDESYRDHSGIEYLSQYGITVERFHLEMGGVPIQ